MSTSTSGPFVVGNDDVSTGITVKAGDFVSVNCSGTIDVGYIFPSWRSLNGDGFNELAGSGYPATNFRRYSLVCRVGATCYQGGTSAAFMVSNAGVLSLLCNDDNRSDNAGAWSVLVTHTRPDVVMPATPQLRVRGIEVVQVIQSVSNSVPLVAGRSSIVRVYVDGTTPGTKVSGILSVTPSDGSPGLTGIMSSGTVAPATPGSTINRSNGSSSLNFSLPPVSAPTAALNVTVFAAGHQGDPSNNGWTATSSLVVQFDTNPHLRAQTVTPILLDNERQPLTTRATFAQYQRGLLGAKTRYPIADAGWVLNPAETTFNADFDLTQSSEWDHLLLALQVNHLAFVDDGNKLTALVPQGAGYAASGKGMAYFWPRLATFVAIAPNGPADLRPLETFAHEMGHEFGLSHASSSPMPAGVDTSLPMVTENPGWDIFVSGAIVPAGSSALMGYGTSPRWPSTVEYMRIKASI